MSLSNSQVEFIEFLLSDDNQSSLLTTAHHISIYRNNVMENLKNALRHIYPLIIRLVGEDFFSRVAQNYIESYPSGSSNIADYGEYFSDFLSTYQSLEHLCYLPEVAQFEWICHTLMEAANPPSFNPYPLLQTLQSTPVAPIQLILHPASALQHFHYPLLRIIELCEGSIDECIDVNEGGVYLLIIRREWKIKLVQLNKDEFIFLQAIQQGLDLKRVLNETAIDNSQFNLIEKLITWIQDQTIVDIYAIHSNHS